MELKLTDKVWEMSNRIYTEVDKQTRNSCKIPIPQLDELSRGWVGIKDDMDSVIRFKRIKER